METPGELKNRLFKEAQAMVSYIADRGIDRELPSEALLKALDLDPEERASVPIRDVMALHHALARAVAPAFPETIEKLHEYRAMSGWWRRLAPLNSILWLIIASIVLAACLAYGLSQFSNVGLPPDYEESKARVYSGTVLTPEKTGEQGRQTSLPGQSGGESSDDTDTGAAVRIPYFLPVIEHLQGPCRFSVEELAAVSDAIDEDNLPKAIFDEAVQQHYENCQELQRTILLRLFLFFGVLGMLGAAYSSIYDSFTYIREGRYDMRLASTYYVRIFLGGFSGILLAQPLSAFLEQGVLSSALLAFIGGFSAQLVYDLLTKLVDSVANMFREDRRKEQQSILARAEFGALGVIQQYDATQRQELAKVLAEAQQEPDPDRRAKAMQDAILGIMSGETETPMSTSPHIALVDQLKRALAFAELSIHAARLWPDEVQQIQTSATSAQTALREALDRVQSSGGAPEDLSLARAALEHANGGDLVTPNVDEAIRALQGAVSGEPLRAAAKSALIASQLLGSVALQRWRYLAYRAAPPTLALLHGVSPDALGDGFASPGGSVVMPDELLLRDPDELFVALGNSFPDRAAFDAALNGWLDVSVATVFAEEWSAQLASVAQSTLSGSALVAALANVAANENARGGLQRLELLGGALHDTSDPEATSAHLLALVDANLTGEAS